MGEKGKKADPASDVVRRHRQAQSEASLDRFQALEQAEAWRLELLASAADAAYRAGQPAMTPCGGGGFERGIDPNEWQGAHGRVQNAAGPNPFATFTGGLLAGPINAQPGANQPGTAHQTWVGPGTDPVVGIPLTPPGASGAVRIGNAIPWSGCELLSKTFTVDPAHSLIGFWYAVVLQDFQDHEINSRPFFWVRVTDAATGALIPGAVDLGGGATKVHADALNNGFFKVQNGTPTGFSPASTGIIVYKDWAAAQIDLSAQVGQTVTVEFVTGDCAHDGHWGYAYLGRFCGDSRGSPEGSLQYDATGSSNCGRGKICFTYTLPEEKLLPTGVPAPGSLRIALDILQNGVKVATLASPVLTGGSQYCFAVDPAAIAGLDPSLGGFDIAATGDFRSGATALPPIKAGAMPDGIKPGRNNDYAIACSVFSYAVKFVCGTQAECDCACAPVRPGRYATEINIYNHGDQSARIVKQVIPVIFGGAPIGREPRVAPVRARDRIELPPQTATMDDCCRLAELLLGAPAEGPMPLAIGYLEIVSPVELTVTAVYTASGPEGGPVSIDVERIDPRPRSAPRPEERDPRAAAEFVPDMVPSRG